MQLKGFNNAKPTRFKTTTQLLNIKCCPLWIKRKGSGTKDARVKDWKTAFTQCYIINGWVYLHFEV